MQPGLVSVIVPNYNHAPFLRERIESILHQTYPNFEVLLLDDCSTDKSREIILSYQKHPQVKACILNDQNSGSTFRQWDKGMSVAKGQFVWIAESDDVAEPDFLTKMVPLLEQNENTVLVYCNSAIIDESGAVIKNCADLFEPYAPGKWKQDYCNYGKEEIRTTLYQQNHIPNASAVLFRRTSWNAETSHGLLEMKYAGDWKFWMRLLRTGSVCYLAEPLNHFRSHRNTTRASRRDLGYYIALYNEMTGVLNEVQDIVPSEKLARQLHKFYFDFCQTLSTYPSETWKESLAQLHYYQNYSSEKLLLRTRHINKYRFLERIRNKVNRLFGKG